MFSKGPFVTMPNARSRSSRSRGAYRAYQPQANPLARVTKPEWFRFYLVAALVVLAALGGGSARPETLSLLYLRPFTLVVLIAILASPGERDYRSVRAPLILLSLFLGSFLIQLVPLPPGLWAALPGHAALAEAGAAAGVEPVWRPISLAPEWTLNSALSLVMGYAVLLGVAGMPLVLQQRLMLLIAGCGVASVVIAILQVTGGGDTLQLYRIHSDNMPNGLFANRNHHAVWLACLLPLLAAYARARGILRAPLDWRVAPVAGAALMILLLIPVTGSRAGLLAGGLMLAAAALIAFIGGDDGRGSGRRADRRRLLIALGVAAVLALLVLGVLALTGKSLSLARFQDVSALEDQRARTLPLILQMTTDFLPFGAGQGTFDPLFRMVEPDDMLSRVFLNHAHNDLLETVLLGGIPALLVVIAFLVWLARAGWVALRSEGPTAVMGRGALAAIAGFLLASLADYPIRTPLVTLTFTFCCVLLAEARAKPLRLT